MDNHKIPQKVLLQTALRQQSVLDEIITSRNRLERSDSTGASSTGSSNSSISVNGSRSVVRVFSSQEVVANADPNFQALHDALVIQLVLVLLFTIVRDSYKAGSVFLDTSFFRVGFGSVHDIFKFLIIEVLILAWGFIVHPVFKLWQHIRKHSQLIDYLFVITYLLYLLGGLGTTIQVLVKWYPLPRLTTFIAGVEQFRVSMKSYSFVRENAYKVLYPWHKDDTSGPAVWYRGQMSPKVGSFQQYCYFLFAPTLLYRDHYPRNKQIRWYAVIVYSLQMFSALWCTVFITINILYPQSLREQDVLHCFMLSLIMGLISLLLCNVTVLHAYMNMVAELMRFADRKFYDAWWTCTSFSSFYRKWNLLVHDWIHCYVYTDIRKALNKRFAVFVTILVSSLVHEYLLALGMGFMLPVVTMLFAGVGVFFYVLKPLANKRLSNLFVLVCLSLGMAIILSVLMLEYASRQHCPTRDGMSWFVPNLIQCYKQYNP